MSVEEDEEQYCGNVNEMMDQKCKETSSFFQVATLMYKRHTKEQWDEMLAATYFPLGLILLEKYTSNQSM